MSCYNFVLILKELYLTHWSGFLRPGLMVLFVFLLAPALNAQEIDLQGHRGARGLMPENTLPAFARALSIGVTTLELDLAVTRDNVVIVSHNPRLNREITRDKTGKWLREDGAVIRQTDYRQLRQFDVGAINPDARYAARFPNQIAVEGTSIPTLDQVFELVKRSGNKTVRFNIETKLYPGKPDLTPSPTAFVEAVLEVIKRQQMSGRVTLQSLTGARFRCRKSWHRKFQPPTSPLPNRGWIRFSLASRVHRHGWRDLIWMNFSKMSHVQSKQLAAASGRPITKKQQREKSTSHINSVLRSMSGR